ncbi:MULTISPECIES: glycerate kinase [unclassified Gilliamella]|uniref:glycerate kinase family protein n=1 Tax=unclassified Gilliamella TaxID=2685620 RepID=UPI0013088D52|nr:MULTISPECIES: glycerate kinase [unclassified Gilliamella]MWP49105.1 glycerate kinase [Gilliamella sp. Lep-s35]MWP69281.1 glycerate kinase [Gilliamella sp. Lep-s5]MWP76844.1 glycerate kinase [Gilliamella sp. Lep-s21]
MKQKTFVLAPDSFKESLTAKEVCEAMESGIKKVFSDAKFVHVPMADGGEGTTQSLVDATNGTLHTCEVTGPLGNKVMAHFGILGDKTTAVIEMASASGIQLVPKESRNPLITTTYGTGELILACIKHGVKKIILGIGGSATNDGGAGMAQALGVKFYDKNDQLLGKGGGVLDKLAKIDVSEVNSLLDNVEFIVASDVTNPLCGEKGASKVFGPQKGATPEMVKQLDKNLQHYSSVIKSQLGKDVSTIPGAGAAGGLGAGLMAFTNSKMEKGINIVIRYSDLENKLKGADFCFTGEGGIDFQTKFGKTPFGVAQVAKAQQVPVIALAGTIGKNIEDLYPEGIDTIFGIIPTAATIEELLAGGFKNIERASENIARLIKITQI